MRFLYIIILGLALPSILTANIKTNNVRGFIENKGQIADQSGNILSEVLFKASGKGQDILITTKGITYVFYKDKPADSTAYYWQRVDIDLTGAHISSTQIIERIITDKASFNYYFPHCPNGILGVKPLRSFTIKDVYPGIDWHWTCNEKGIKYDFIVHPGADPRQITFLVSGSNRIRTEKEGKQLVITTNLGNIEEGDLYCYQHINGIQMPVAAHYQINSANNHQVSFKLSGFQPDQQLIIDPPMPLVWATFFGGSGGSDPYERVETIDTDASANLFAVGFTRSKAIPVLNPGGAFFQGTALKDDDGFITKFDANGVLLWATYFGGDNLDACFGVVADPAGNAYVTGKCNSSNLPTIDMGGGAYYQPAYAGGGDDAYIAKFDANGVAKWISYFGGDEKDKAFGITLDSKGNVIIAGDTWTASNLPKANPGGGAFYQVANGGKSDLFISRFSATGTLTWSTYVGGNDEEYAADYTMGIDIDPSDNLYIGFNTLSANFPTKNPGGGAYFDNIKNSFFDACILKFDANGVMTWSTFFGGSGMNRILALELDKKQNICVSGYTDAANFPTKNPGGTAYMQLTKTGVQNCFISKFTNTGSLFWSTYFTGNNIDRGQGFAFDNMNNIFLVSTTSSNNFPTMNPGGGIYFKGTYSAGDDMAFSCFTENGVMVWSTYLGGSSQWEGLYEADIDVNGCLVAGDQSGPDASAITLDPGAGAYFQSAPAAQGDMYIIKFCDKLIPKITVTTAAPLCFKDSSSATAHATGGTPPYTYSWAPTGGTDSIAYGLIPGTYTVTVTDANNNTAIEIITITSPPALTLTVPPQQSICLGDSIKLNASASGGTPAYSYAWSHGDNDSSATVKPLTDTEYILEVSDKNGCKIKDTVMVKVAPGISALAGPNTTLCIGDSVQLSATGGSSYSWSPAAGLSNPNVSDPVATPTATTLYTVTVSSGSCAPATAVVNINVVPNITASINPDTAICEGEKVSLTASGGSSYLWSPAATLSDSLSATVTASPVTTTSYSVTVTSGSCAPATNSVTITVNPKPVTTISSSDTIQPGENLALLATGGSVYSWTPATGLDNANTANPLASPTITTTYTVTITDSNGCKATELVIIYVENECDDADPFIPNAFSPNADGINDNLELRTPNIECIVKYHLTIFNRWGEKVYDSTDPKEKWDGTYKSQPCDAAVFDYFLDAELIDGTLIAKKGNVSLIK